MKEKPTGKTTAKKLKTDWARVRALGDKEIRSAIERDPEVRPTDASFWTNAKLVVPAAKQTITIRLDADLLEWFRNQKGYQTRINAVLRTYMDAQKPAQGRTAPQTPTNSKSPLRPAPLCGRGPQKT